jgi:hypothetical protein
MQREPTFTLTNPRDLFGKLEHDRRRLHADPCDAYAAFDFFITVTAFAQWCRKASWELPIWATKDGETREHTIYRVCIDIANGSKHFAPQDSIKGTSPHDGAFDGDAFDADAFDTDGLLIFLKGRDKTILGQDVLWAHKLADEVLAMCRDHLAKHHPST